MRMRRTTASGAGLELAAVAAEALNYSLAHNGMPPLRGVELRNTTDSELSGLVLEAELTSPLELALAKPLATQVPDLEPGRKLSLDLPPRIWPLEPAAFAQLDEAESGTIRITVKRPDGGRVTAEQPVRILARDEWWARFPETLVAFVAPRDPEIRALLNDASEILERTTGRADLQGYQSGTARAMQIAESIYQAMQARQIRYIDPPASFEHTGQKIRPPHEVLTERFGTCLDLAVQYTAALEAAGLNPVIFTAVGHAFAGFIAEDAQLRESMIGDASTMLNLVDAGLVVPVETTALTKGADTTFEGARRATRAWWAERAGSLEALIDVRATHYLIRPLPVLRRDGVAGVTVVVEEKAEPLPAALPQARPQEADLVRAGSRLTVDHPPRITAWRNKLLDLTLRNPLLNYRPARGIPLVVPKGGIGTLEDLFHEGHRLRLTASDELTDAHRAMGARGAADLGAEVLIDVLKGRKSVFVAVPQGSYHSRLRTLRRKAQSIIDESGSNDLYLTFGTMVWSDGKQQLRAPLFLLPVSLSTARPGQPFTIQIEEGAYVLPNYCLLEKLRLVHALELPDLERPEEDAAGIDLPGAFQGIRLSIERAALPFRVEEDAHLAILQFANLRMWQDLGEHWEQFLANPVVDHLVNRPSDSFEDPVAAPESTPEQEATTFCPVATDGSQLQAVQWAAAGRTFVLEGPPGTGKSQTITNLIAHCLAEGKRVLFVAEKQAALEVVKRRLDAVGIGPFCLDIHGRDQSPGAVRAQLRDTLHHSVEADTQSWDALRSQYAALAADLARYPGAIHEPGPAGMSAWSARQVLLQLADAPDVEVDRAVVEGRTDLQRVEHAARSLAPLVGAVRPINGHPWSLAAPTPITALDRDAVVSAVSSLASSYASLGPDPLRSLIRSLPSPEVFQAATTWTDAAAAGLVPPPGYRTITDDPRWRDAVERFLAGHREHRARYAATLAQFAPSVLGLQLQPMLDASAVIDQKVFKKRKRRAIIAQIDPHRVAGTTDLATLTATLNELIAWQRATAELLSSASALPVLALPPGWEPNGPDSEQQLRSAAAVAAAGAELGRAGRDVATGMDLTAHGLLGSDASAVVSVATAWTALTTALGSRPEDVRAWLNGRTWGEAIDASLGTWLSDSGGTLLDLNRWLQVSCELEQLRLGGLHQLVDEVSDGAIAGYDLPNALNKGLARAVLSERLRAGGLDVFDPRQHDRVIARFIETGRDARREMVAALPSKIVAARGISPQRLVGVAGQLNRELNRQRGGLSIRQLLTTYGEVIQRLTPCLMMSPGTVARFLAPGAVDIDVVVFDEASQLRVAESVGAMGRGKSVIVVGDSKQMPPSSFGAVSPAEEPGDADLAPPDEESILSECANVLDRLWLSWHYRSKDEALIAFSNRQYYEGRLSSFPAPPRDAGNRELGVRFVRVGGTFERGAGRVNRKEAQEIVAAVRARLRVNPRASIGVVTFNSEQRELILDMLEEAADPLVNQAMAAEADPLFVKNLENVQGDERDIILFSLAFSRSPTRGVLDLNFGPLNRQGGERRLNVAVTRARELVVLFASFEPEDIDLSRTASVGLAHLRNYMEAAAYGEQALASIRPAAGRDRHLDDVAEWLVSAGLLVQRDIGLSDFTIDLAAAEQPHGPWVAVLLDGPRWARRSTVGDRDALPNEVLVNAMGWHAAARIWLPAWIADPESQVDRVRGLLAAAPQRREPPPPAPHEQVADPVVPTRLLAGGHMIDAAGRPIGTARPESPSASGSARGTRRPAPSAPPNELTYTPARDRTQVGDKEWLNHLDDPRAQEFILRIVEEILAEEGPIEAGRLVRLVGASFGWQRVRQDRRDALVRMIPSQRRTKDGLGEFVWPKGIVPAEWPHWRRTPSGVARKLDEVPPREIANAMDHLAEVGFGIPTEELLRSTAEVFGSSRLTAPVRTRLEGVLERELAAGRLVRTGDIVRSVD